MNYKLSLVVSSAKLLPQRFELGDKRPHDGGVLCHDDVLLVAHDGLHRPVEGAARQLLPVDDGELVVHEVVGLAGPNECPSRVELAHLFGSE